MEVACLQHSVRRQILQGDLMSMAERQCQHSYVFQLAEESDLNQLAQQRKVRPSASMEVLLLGTCKELKI